MARVAIDISGGKIKETDFVVGIDLGTTNSLIAKIIDGNPVVISDFDKAGMVPSVVHINTNGTIVVGEEAKNQLVNSPKSTVYSVKRLLGKSYKDIEKEVHFFSYPLVTEATGDIVQIEINSQKYMPVEVSAMILKELKQRAEHKLKTEIKKAVITVPAYFNDSQRQATRDAGKLAGLEVLRIVNEPTAAALAYGIGIDTNEEKTIVVYDLGGGTFDVTILRLEKGIFEVLATNGDTYLGGDDFDRVIVEHWLSTYSISKILLEEHKSFGQELRLLAEYSKQVVGENQVFTKEITLPNKDKIILKLDKEKYESLILPLVQKSLKCCQNALKDAQLKVTDIQTVILVGGSTRTPLVRQQVEHFFNQKPYWELNPDEVVALGAAIQGDILAGNRKDILLLDVTPLSLGIETVGSLMDTLIPRNSKIPIAVAKNYTTSIDAQINLKVAVYQGERELIKDNRKLAEFELRGIPAMPAGLPKIEIKFLLDADGILQVSAKELRSGIAQEIAVKPQYGLTDAEVEKMLLDSFTNAENDFQTRLLIETQEEAKMLISRTKQFINKNHSAFSTSEITEIEQLIIQLQQKISDNNRTTIQNAIQKLDDISRPFAEKIMDEAVRKALIGTNIQQKSLD